MPENETDTSAELIGNSQSVIIDAGTLEFSAEDLTATGLLVPYGVKSRSNIGEFSVDAGVFTVPEDLTGAALNVEHERADVVGGLSRVWEQSEGLFASFKFANTEDGRAAFAKAKDGSRKNLSVEAAKVRIRDGKAISGRVFGAALVEKPAFAGATLLAAEDTDEANERLMTREELEAELAAIKAELDAHFAVMGDEPTELSEDSESDETTPTAAPAEESDSDNPKEIYMSDNTDAGAQVPATLLASAPAVVTPRDIDLDAVFASMSAVKRGVANSADAETLLAALSDITTPAHVTSGAIPPTFAGKLWQGKRYTSRYAGLVNHSEGGISLGGRKGFKIAQGSALGAEITNANQKVELPSGTATTALYGSTLRKFGFAADYALEWQYLEGGAEVLQAFFEGVVDSIAKLIDESALKDIFTVASKTTTALDRLVAPATYPTQYTAAMGQLIQGIDLVSDNGDDPSFAIVNAVAWNQLLYTPKDLVPEFVEFGVGIGTGEGTAGKVRVVKAPNSFFTGLGAAKPQVIVGAKNAIELREQHIEIDALEVAKFGVDRAQVAFLETFVVRPESLALIGAV